MPRALLAFDTDHIKQYVFATEKLKEIRGASALLDDLNRREMARIVGGQKWYAHGGSGLFVVDTSQVERAIADVRQAYANATAGMVSITGVSLPLPDKFNLERDDIRPYWDHLGLKLEAAKRHPPGPRVLVTHPLLRPCDSCGIYYSTSIVEDGLICPACQAKRDQNQASRAREKGMPEDFDAIGRLSSPEGYFALIYADGDGFGRELAQCRTLPALRSLATGIDEVLHDVVANAVKGLPAEGFDRLLLGGDDLVMVVQAQSALDVTLAIVEGFRARIGQRLGPQFSHPLTLSAAVVWAHTHFPFGALRDLAESALKFAKQQGAARGAPGLVNFLAVSGPNHLDFKTYYLDVLRSQLPTETLYRTLRPYTPADLRRLYGYRRSFAPLSRAKLEALRRAVFQPSRQQAELDGLRVLLSLSSEGGDHLRRDLSGLPRAFVPGSEFQFPWARVNNDLFSPLADLAEIWDFVEGDEHAGG